MRDVGVGDGRRRPVIRLRRADATGIAGLANATRLTRLAVTVGRTFDHPAAH